MRHCRADEIAKMVESGGQILPEVHAQGAPMPFREHLKISSRLRGFH